ncbi:MAG: patatin-like phospholipase family protein [Lentimicrobiaceae bacterium]|jgi:NTE family protein
MKKNSFLLLFLIFFLSASPQKVAVVLSGGGAKGVAHIGVLRALEENGIPIDYIAGTSMGAIIGGLYASGYSPDQMQQILNSEEFAKWVSGKLDDQYTYFFRQGQPNASWLSFKFKYDSVLQTQLPTNIVSPLRMDFAFLELFSQASAVAGYDFNKLMVPFRCVAADIRYNKPYILRKGDVGSAIRASMTFPFYFKPIRIDGRLLFDGGMYNNFPSDVVMEDFYPDIIIGSKAAGNYDPPKEDDVVSQLSSMLMGETKFNLYCNASVLVEPKLKDVNVIDFTNTEAFIDSGYVSTLRLIPQIRQFILDTVSQAEHDSIRKHFNARKPDLKVNNIEVHGLQQGQSLYIANAIMGQVNARKSNDLDLKKVKAGYFKVVGENRLKSVYPTLLYDTITQRYSLVIDAQYQKGIVADFGGSLSSGGSNEIFLQLKYSLWRKIAYTAKINGSFGRFYNSALIGGRMEIPGRKPKYLEAEYTFNQFNYFRTKSIFFVDATPSFLYENNTYFRVDMGFPITYKGKFEAGITWGSDRSDYFQTNTATKEDKEDRTKFNFYSPYIEMELNTLNRKQYSNEGYRIYASAQFVSGLERHTPGTTSVLKGAYTDYHNYFIAKFMYDKYFRVGKIYKPGINFEFQVNNLENFRNFTSTALSLPAYNPVYEMATIYQSVYRPDGYTAIGMRNIFTVSKNMDFRLEGFIMAPFRELYSNSLQQVVKSDLFPSLQYILSASFVYNTPIGPLSACLNYYDDGDPVSFYVNIGFIIFNRSAF